MSKIRRKKDKEKLASMLDEYQQEKCLGPRNCKLCTFSVNNHTGCALNLVCNSVEHDLSSYKEKSDEQWNHILYGHGEPTITYEEIQRCGEAFSMDTIARTINEMRETINPIITNEDIVDFIRDHLLGEAGILLTPITDEKMVFMWILHTMLYRYSKEYKKDFIIWKNQKDIKK